MVRRPREERSRERRAVSNKTKKKSQRRPNVPPMGATPKQVTFPKETGLTPPASREFAPDYTYVIKDLRRIAILAGSIIVGLIVLSFFMP
jgi:hypothetical protein